MSDPVRLSKRVADLAGCSRTEAEQYIKGGWVSVDGRVVEDPAHPVSIEVVTVDPAARLERVETATILLHKPDGFRSEEHTSELQSLMRRSYAVCCLKKKMKD